MLSEALRLFRVYNDLKLVEMANKLGISKSYLSEIETGKKEPSLKVLNKYSEVFQLPLSSIINFGEKLNSHGNSLKEKIAKKILELLQEIELNGN